jgi:undecaprenyl-diphosphatase
MNIFEAFLLGTVQGVTEFVPISSSGHTFLLAHYLGIEAGVVLTVMLHAASLLAVVLYFRKDIMALLKGLWIAAQARRSNPEAALSLKLLVATLLTVPTALTVEYFLPFNTLTPTLVAVTLIVTGVLILLSQYMYKGASDFTWTTALLLGLIQGVAVIPGISRSGLTIAFLIFMGVAYKESARLSFLLAIPTIFGAVLFAIGDVPIGGLFGAPIAYQLPLYGAFICSFIASILSIKYMLRLVEGRWVAFAPYCFLLALGIFLL